MNMVPVRSVAAAVTCLLLAMGPCSSAQAAPAMAVSLDDMEAVGPFASWLNVKSAGAVGNGTTDDTNALQAALDRLSGDPASGAPAVLYLPAGTYRITRTLNLTAKSGVSIIGDQPSTTRIVWDGAVNGQMLNVNGGFMNRYARITWDGKSKALIGVGHFWKQNGDLVPMSTSMEHVDEVFTDMGFGIMAGRENAGAVDAGWDRGDSEGQVRRVKFIRNSRAGLDVGGWNALDWWVWDSEFIDCARGLSNRFTLDADGALKEDGKGNFVAYRSVFRNSTVSDAHIANTGWFAMHQNVSLGSQQFYRAEQMGVNGAALVLQGNRIIDTKDTSSVLIGNAGPLLMFDNVVRSTTTTGAAAVKLNDYVPSDAMLLGNTFTVSSPLQKGMLDDRVRLIGNTTLPASRISSTAPTLPGVATNYKRAVFDVPANASRLTVQSVINRAAASTDANPIVHFPPGRYVIDQSLTVPAQRRIQLVGDSAYATELLWSGPAAGTIIALNAPSQATVRELRLLDAARTSSAIRMRSADQAGGRVYIGGSLGGNVVASSLANTRIEGQANGGLGNLKFNAVGSAVFVGNGGVGSVDLRSNSNVALLETWYEGTKADWFRGDSGNFTFLAGLLAPSDHGGTNSEAAIQLSNFKGIVTFAGLLMNMHYSSNGILIDSETAQTGALFLGVSADWTSYFDRLSSGGTIGLALSRKALADDNMAGSAPTADKGQTDDNTIKGGMAQARAIVWDRTARTVPAKTVTDVRIYRVHAADTGLGLDVAGTP